MKKKGLFIGIGAVVLVVVLVVGGLISTYNGLVDKKATVENAEAQIQTQLQRRADLIPNLVNTVKGYASHETEVYTALADARAKLNSASNAEEYTEALESYDSAISRLLVVVENYPELKANQNFIYLQDELSGTENRIGIARKDYNDTATEYNKSIKKFPIVIFAGILGFEKAELFEASDSAQNAPVVDFE
ncbi:MAG: LemA family protein [Clostridia bacterium]|nr:LemA family protein [Clostridia bacterium]